jgi:hypothetical protein
MPSNIKTLAVAAAASALLAAGVGASRVQAATSGPCWGNTAKTCHPNMTTSWKPWVSPRSQGAQYWTIGRGTIVDMRCWTTGATQLKTAKWFYVISTKYPYTRGYVPANAVGNQIVVGRC